MSETGFYFTTGTETVRLPVNPTRYRRSKAGLYRTVEPASGGRRELAAGGCPEEVGIDGFFPGDPDRPYVLTKNDFQTPGVYTAFFRRLCRSGEGVQLTVIRDGQVREEESMMVTVSAFSFTEEGAGGDVEYALTLLEQDLPESTRLSAGSAGEAPLRHTVREGETLLHLAQRYYGDLSGWRTIAEANGLSGYAVLPGTVVLVPEKEDA